MANEETLGANPASQENAVHAADYGRFIRMMKYGAVITGAIGLIVIMILK